MMCMLLSMWFLFTQSTYANGQLVIEGIDIQNVTRYEALNIDVNIQSDSAINTVTLYYRMQDNLPYRSALMQHVEAGLYRHTLTPFQTWSLEIDYYVVATNADLMEGTLGSESLPRTITLNDFDYEVENLPKLLITEAYTAGADPGNRVEFFEVYNASSETINLFDYKFQYVSRLYSGTLASPTFDLQYADREINYGSLTSFNLEPGEVVVILNGMVETTIYQDKPALQYFNEYFGTNLVLHENALFMTVTTGVPGNNAAGGMNSRGWAIKTSTDVLVSQIFFHLNPDGSNFATNNTGSLPASGLNSIQYGFKQMTIQMDMNDPKRPFMSLISADEYPANPGSVWTDQVPVSSAEQAPLLTILNSNHQQSLNVNQSTINLETVMNGLIEITHRGYDYEIEYLVTKDDQPITVDQNTIPALQGIYKVQLRISPSINGQFDMFVSDIITLEVLNELIAPQLTIHESVVVYSETTPPASLDLLQLFEDAYSIQYGSYEGYVSIEIRVYDHLSQLVATPNNIMSYQLGEYQVRIVLKPTVVDLFSDVISDVITLSIVSDNQAPAISNVIIDGEYRSTITISIDVNENQGLKAEQGVMLYYALANQQIPKGLAQATFFSAEMTSTNQLTFEVSIPSNLTWSQQIHYYIEAIDASGNVGTFGTKQDPKVIELDVPVYASTDQPHLLITEIFVGGGATSDPYEFFEVYNNYYQPINLFSYQFFYVSRIFTNYDTRNMQIEYSRKFVQWGALTEYYLQPGQTVVFANGAVSGIPTTDAQFNSYFPGSSVQAGVNYFNILNEDLTILNATGTNGAGGLNSRGWAIKNADGDLISQGYTHLNLDGSNLPKGASSLSANGANKTTLMYGFRQMQLADTANTDPNNTWNQLLSADQFSANPGWVFTGQVPASFAQPSPTITTLQNSTSMSLQSGDASINIHELLNTIYTIQPFGFEDEYLISYEVTLNDSTTIVETSIDAIIGQYTVRVILTSKNPYGFSTIYSTPITLIINSSAVAPEIEINNDRLDVDITGLSVLDIEQLLEPLYVITYHDFDASDVIIEYRITLGGQDVVINDGTIIPLAGTYNIRIILKPVQQDDFVTIESTEITLRQFKEAPVLTPEASVIYRTIAAGQNSINLSWLYEFNPGGFDDEEFVISYRVTRESQQVHLIGSTIMPTPGTYRVTFNVDPVNEGAFEPISITVTMIATKVAPTIALNDEYLLTQQIYRNMSTIDLLNMFFVYGGAFQTSEYQTSISVKKETENIPVIFGTIPAIPGIYEIIISVRPTVSGAFPDVIMDDIILLLEPALPEINATTNQTIIVEKANDSVSLTDLYSISGGYYALSDLIITYEISKNGSSVNVEDHVLEAKNGTYEITITVSHQQGAFSPIHEVIMLTIDNRGQTTRQTIVIATISTSVLATSAIMFFVIRKKRLIGI